MGNLKPKISKTGIAGRERAPKTRKSLEKSVKPAFGADVTILPMLKVMTFNIRYGTAADGDSHWTRRKHLVIKRICAFDPDLLGLQKCRYDKQAEFVRS